MGLSPGRRADGALLVSPEQFLRYCARCIHADIPISLATVLSKEARVVACQSLMLTLPGTKDDDTSSKEHRILRFLLAAEIARG
jgi:hypothetical protein